MAFSVKSISIRLTLYFVLLSMTSVCLLGFSSWRTARVALRRSVFQRLDTAISLKEAELRRWIEDRKGDVVFLGSLPGFRVNSEIIVKSATDSPSALEARRELLLRTESFIHDAPDFREIMVLAEAGGKVVFSTDRTHEGDYRVTDTFFREGRQRTFVQSVYPWPVTLIPTITISTPLVSDGGEKLGVLAVHMDLNTLEMVMQEKLGLGKTAETYLVTKNSVFVSTERFDPTKYPRGVHTQGVDAAVRGSSGHGLYRNYLGVAVVGAYRWIPELELALLAEISQEEAFTPAWNLGWTIFALGLAVILLLTGAVPALSRRITRPILAVRDAALKVAEGDLTARAPIATDDEVGDLARSFNRMAGELEGLYEALRQSEKHFRTIFQTSPDAIAVTRYEDATILDVNPGFTAVTGYSREELLGRSTLDIGFWNFPSDRKRLLRDLAANPQVAAFEAEFRRRDGNLMIGLLSSTILELEGERAILTVLRDVTNVRLAEEALRASERSYRELVESVNSIVLRWDSQGRVNFINRYGEEFFGFSQEELIGRSVLGTIVPRQESSGRDLETMIRGILFNPDHFSYNENQNIRKNGARVWVSWTNRAILDKEGNLIEILSVGNDITARKQTEEALRSSLKEKEVLLKEVHHRVKNNLQVISGLLNLQAHHITEPGAQDIFRESQNRVITMALIHEELYGTRDLAQVDFGLYLENLARNLMASYSIRSERVRMHVDSDRTRMVVDTAIPCGLIVNELISNSLKHAFPAGRTGNLTVTFRTLEDGRYHLEVADDGVGLPPGFEVSEARSLGLQLVTVMSQNLGADLSVLREGGTRWIMTFREYHEAGSVLT